MNVLELFKNKEEAEIIISALIDILTEKANKREPIQIDGLLNITYRTRNIPASKTKPKRIVTYPFSEVVIAVSSEGKEIIEFKPDKSLHKEENG